MPLLKGFGLIVATSPQVEGGRWREYLHSFIALKVLAIEFQASCMTGTVLLSYIPPHPSRFNFIKLIPSARDQTQSLSHARQAPSP